MQIRPMNPVLAEMYRTGQTTTVNGELRKAHSGITAEEARALGELISAEKCKTAAETGVGFGFSTLSICDALASVGASDAKLYGVDPNQMSLFGGAAIAALKQANLSQYFELVEGSSHLVLPNLCKQGVQLDFAFVDGWHTFDYTLLDLFYFDKMLRPGGLLAIHDALMPSVVKALKYQMTHRKYETVPVECISKSILGKTKGLVYSMMTGFQGISNRIRELRGHTNLVILRKNEDFEPNYDFFMSF